jgi:complex iron-sulfur molybdoenzyme family reductase subunit gamma
VISFPRSQEQFTFEPGKTIPLAFAAWDGAKDERGGEKAISTWYFLSLEKLVGNVAYWAPVLAFVGAAAAQTGILRHVRRRARTQGATSA